MSCLKLWKRLRLPGSKGFSQYVLTFYVMFHPPKLIRNTKVEVCKMISCSKVPCSFSEVCLEGGDVSNYQCVMCLVLFHPVSCCFRPCFPTCFYLTTKKSTYPLLESNTTMEHLPFVLWLQGNLLMFPVTLLS